MDNADEMATPSAFLVFSVLTVGTAAQQQRVLPHPGLILALTTAPASSTTAVSEVLSLVWSLTRCAFIALFMPRIRERNQQNQAISVTPWMNKKGSVEGAASSKPGSDKRQKLMYSVLLADAQFSASGFGPCDDTAALVTAPEPSPRSIDTVRTFAGSGEWHSVRRKQPHSLAGDSTPASQAARGDKHISSNPEQRTALQGLVGPATAIQADLASNPSAVWDVARPQFADEDQAPQQQPQQPSLQGVAQLILLPSGTIAGHFIAQYSSTGPQQQHHLVPLSTPVCLGLHGKQVLGIHSCYRDPEWALLQMSVIKYSSSSNSGSSRANSKGASSSSKPSGSSRSPGGPGATLVAAADGAAAVSSAGASHVKQADGCDDSRTQQQEDDQQQERQQQQQQQSHVKRLCIDSSEQSPDKKRRVDQHMVDQSHQSHRLQTVSSNDPQAAAAAAAVAGGSRLVDAADASSEEVTTDSSDIGTDPTAAAAAAAAAFDAMDDASSSSIAAEAVAWVQRTGGDLVKLSPADLDDEDTMTVILQDNLGLDPDFVHVDFKAKSLLAGAAADDRLRIGWPQLVGQEGVVVNIGSMTLSNLPHGWLG